MNENSLSHQLQTIETSNSIIPSSNQAREVVSQLWLLEEFCFSFTKNR